MHNAFLFSTRSVVSGSNANPRRGHPINETTSNVYISIHFKMVQFQSQKRGVGRMDGTAFFLFGYFESYWRSPLLDSFPYRFLRADSLHLSICLISWRRYVYLYMHSIFFYFYVNSEKRIAGESVCDMDWIGMLLVVIWLLEIKRHSWLVLQITICIYIGFIFLRRQQPFQYHE